MRQLIAAPAEAPPPSGAVGCPRCQKPLIDPSGLGWCKACGYCHSLAESEKAAIPQVKPASPRQMTVPGAQPRKSIKWVFGLVLGMIVVGGATYAGSQFLKLSPLDRALLTTVQIVGSLLLMFFTQFIGLMKIAPEDPTLSFKDALFPFKLYPLALKRLPKTRLTIYGGAWGVTSIVTVMAFVGGLGHWFTYLPGNKNHQPNQVQKPRSAR